MSRIGDFADDDVSGWIALSPELGKAMAAFSGAVYNRNRLPMRVREIARIVMAYDNECVVCQNTRDADGPAAGVDEDLYAHALEWRTWPGYSEQERLAAEFSHRFASDHIGLRADDEFWGRCREHFSDELIADLKNMVTSGTLWENTLPVDEKEEEELIKLLAQKQARRKQ
jgi:alkylhydroperoxidase family enzyme